MSDQYRHWLVTLFPSGKDDLLWADELYGVLEELVKKDILRYAIFQGEKSPTTEKEHIQMYLEFYRSKRLSNLIKYLKNDYWKHPHCESRKGTRETAKAYCSKRESRIPDFGPHEFGTWRKPKRTAKSKIQTCAQLMELGWSSAKIAWERPDLYLRYGDRIDKCLELRFNYYQIQSANQRKEMLKLQEEE